jgi:hypothetical protein
LADSAFVDQQKSAMAKAVNERNELILHFLAKWNPASPESTLAIIVSLDAQRDNTVMGRPDKMSVAPQEPHALSPQARVEAQDCDHSDGSVEQVKV